MVFAQSKLIIPFVVETRCHYYGYFFICVCLQAQQLVSLKHIQSLWVFLCFERASILAAHHQVRTLRKAFISLFHY